MSQDHDWRRYRRCSRCGALIPRPTSLAESERSHFIDGKFICNSCADVIRAGGFVYPGGLPLYWMNETSGLVAAVQAYLNNRTDGAMFSKWQALRVREYLAYYVHAPCWDRTGFDAELGRLRESVVNLHSAKDGYAAIAADCMKVRTPQNAPGRNRLKHP